MYRSSAIVKQWTDKEGTSLRTEEDCRMAMVWIALLGGGDYAPEGLTGFGEFIKLNFFGRTQLVVIREGVWMSTGLGSFSCSPSVMARTVREFGRHGIGERRKLCM